MSRADKITLDGSNKPTVFTDVVRGNQITLSAGTPAIAAYPAGTQNGKNYVRRVQGNDRWAASAFTISQPYVVQWVQRTDSAAVNGVMYENANCTLGTQPSGGSPMFVKVGGNPNLLANGQPTNTWFVVTGVVNGASSVLYKNLSAIASGNCGTATISSPTFFNSVAGTQVSQIFDTGRLRFYDRLLTADQLTVKITELMTDWGIS
jgi:hypothetical protein